MSPLNESHENSTEEIGPAVDGQVYFYPISPPESVYNAPWQSHEDPFQGHSHSSSESSSLPSPEVEGSTSSRQFVAPKVSPNGVRTRRNPLFHGTMTPSLSWQGHTPLPQTGTPDVEFFNGMSSAFSTPGPGRIQTNAATGQSIPDATSAILRTGSEGHTQGSKRGPVNEIRRRKLFQSQLLDRTQAIDKPWMTQRSRKLADRRAFWTFLITCVLGLLGAIALVLTAWLEFPKYKYCLVLEDNFSGTAIDTSIWFQEQQTGGFGTGEFEWVTNSTNNSYVQDGYLYIVPTLTSDFTGIDAITNGYTLNLTSDGTCTSSNKSDTYCAVASNSTEGIILPPVQSARLVTNFSTSIKYGRVEVRAKLPTGDWIWPAIWMMPKDSVYGAWPRSGEIDIVESKGNKVTSRSSDGPNNMHSTLHWGLDSDTDMYELTTKTRTLYRDYYDEEFHTFGLDWTPKGIKMWEGSPIHSSLSYDFGKGFWEEGDFPTVSSNGTTYTDPWPTDDSAAPFDQEFFLILSVAVGGTNGFFDETDMPWSNTASNAVNEFWAAKDKWYPSWPASNEDRAMVVDYVKMWNLEGVDGVQCPTTPLT